MDLVLDDVTAAKVDAHLLRMLQVLSAVNPVSVNETVSFLWSVATKPPLALIVDDLASKDTGITKRSLERLVAQGKAGKVGDRYYAGVSLLDTLVLAPK